MDDDFDIDESSAESENVEEERAAKPKQLYKDPRKKNQEGPTVVPAQKKAKTEKRVYKKRKNLVASTDRVVRESTKQKTEIMNEQISSASKKPKRKNKKRVVRTLSQKEILAEAKITEKLNTESLNAIKAWEEEEKQRRKKKGPDITGARVIYHSVGPKTIITFKDCDGCLPECFKALDGKTNEHPAPVHEIKSVATPQLQNMQPIRIISPPKIPQFHMQKEMSVPQIARKKQSAQPAMVQTSRPLPVAPPSTVSVSHTSQTPVTIKKPYYSKKSDKKKPVKRKDFDKEDYDPVRGLDSVAGASGSTRSGRKVKNKLKKDDDFISF